MQMPTKQESGLYCTKVKIGVDTNGKDVVQWISDKTKKELEDAKRETVERYYIGGTGLNEDRLFGEYAAGWYHVRKEPFVSASTKHNYRTMLNKHLFPIIWRANDAFNYSGRFTAFCERICG